MKFYHFASPGALQALMRGKKTGIIPTLCPTSDLMDYGSLTLYCRHERSHAFRLSQQDPMDSGNVDGGRTSTNVGDLEYVKLGFEEKGGGRNQMTLGLLTKRERERFLKDEDLPQDAALVFTMPKDWERKQNRALTGGVIVLAIDDLVTVFQNNLMQVINAKRPHNARLYPDGKSKLEATKNIHAYASVYLKGYQKRFDRVLNDPHHTVMNLMNAATLADFKQEQTFVVTLKTVTNLLSGLVDQYRQNRVPKDLEERIVHEVSALSRDIVKYSYL